MSRSMYFVALFFLGLATAFPESHNAIPSFNYQQILDEVNGVSSEKDVLSELTEASRTLGAFVITNLPQNEEYLNALKSLESEASSCFEDKSLPEKMISLRVSPSVMRTTSAVHSADPTTVHPSCIRSSAETIKSSMNQVGSLVHQFIAQIAGPRAYYKLPDQESRIPLESSPNLDHVHLYTSTEDDSSEPTASLHTDNGLFLLATPTREAPLHVMDADGKMLTTLTSEPGIVVLFGRAMDKWLLASKAETLFRPAPHSVPALKANKKRVIFARMYVAPKEALPIKGKSVKFGDFFMGEKETHSRSNLCPSFNSSPASPSASALLWRHARATMCDEGTQFCWMSCLPIDSQCPAGQQTCYSSTHKPCCLEGQTAADGCADMDPTCKWHCS